MAVDWMKYGKSKEDELMEDYRISQVHFAQCSTHLSFDEYLKMEGIYLKTGDTPSESEA